jgi:uncharacterized protein YbbC (DUF1343 family)
VPVSLGLERFAADPFAVVRRGERVGLLTSSACVDGQLRPSKEVVAAALGSGQSGGQGGLTCLFGPQHGVNCDVQDNMVETGHARDPALGIPVWSLYGDTRVPTDEMLAMIDVLLVDIQDVGTRVYTFIWTLRLALAACGRKGVRVVVLDRPNPIGGTQVEGNLIDPKFSSFVGLEPIPMRHAMTVGELARWFVKFRGVQCELDVVELAGWRRPMYWLDTGLPWVMPSPNMPTPDTAVVYPGTVLFEGTNASEGRGTTRPFELVGGPWGRHGQLADAMTSAEISSISSAAGRQNLPGVHFRAVTFEPTFHKWTNTPTFGVQLHVTDRAVFKPYLTGLALLSAFWSLYSDEGFSWRAPPYEYEEVKLPIHLLVGSEAVREGLEAGVPVAELERGWSEELKEWEEERRACLLY